jgi:hypothetical protein
MTLHYGLRPFRLLRSTRTQDIGIYYISLNNIVISHSYRANQISLSQRSPLIISIISSI